MEQRKLFKVGYGKYEFYVVAEDDKQAINKVIARENNVAFLPLEVKEEITKIDGYNILLVTDEELAEADKEDEKEIESHLDAKQLDKMKKEELIKLAADMEIETNEDMTKKEIIDLITKEKIVVNEENIVKPEETEGNTDDSASNKN